MIAGDTYARLECDLCHDKIGTHGWVVVADDEPWLGIVLEAECGACHSGAQPNLARIPTAELERRVAAFVDEQPGAE